MGSLGKDQNPGLKVRLLFVCCFGYAEGLKIAKANPCRSGTSACACGRTLVRGRPIQEAQWWEQREGGQGRSEAALTEAWVLTGQAGRLTRCCKCRWSEAKHWHNLITMLRGSLNVTNLLERDKVETGTPVGVPLL